MNNANLIAAENLDLSAFQPSPGLVAEDAWRDYRLFDQEQRRQLWWAPITDPDAAEPRWVAAFCHRNQVVALLAVAPFEEGSRHYGIAMAHLVRFAVDSHFFENMETRNQVRHELWQAYNRWRSKNPIDHTAFRLPTWQLETRLFLQARGFAVMDTMVTYLYDHRQKRPLPQLRALFQVGQAVEKEHRQLLEMAAHSFAHTRFTADPSLDQRRTPSFYRNWCLRLLEQNPEYCLVARNSAGQPVGFLAFCHNPSILGLSGIKLLGGGLSAALPGVPGVYPSLLKRAFETFSDVADCAEFETQIENAQVIRTWHALKCRQVLTTHSLHCHHSP